MSLLVIFRAHHPEIDKKKKLSTKNILKSKSFKKNNLNVIFQIPSFNATRDNWGEFFSYSVTYADVYLICDQKCNQTMNVIYDLNDILCFMRKNRRHFVFEF